MVKKIPIIQHNKYLQYNQKLKNNKQFILIIFFMLKNVYIKVNFITHIKVFKLIK